MRRGINIRKRKQLISKEINQKSLKLLSILIITLFFCTIIYFSFIQNIFIKKNVEEDSINFSNLNNDIPVSLKKIILFSSATAQSDSINQMLSLDISQYCDIGIYLDSKFNNNISISSLYIDNIIISSPEIGTPYLYKKSISDLGKCSFSEDNIINDNFNFNIIDTETPLNYNNYEIYNDGSTPISLGFYNKNIKTEFISENPNILYNGTLLKEASIPLVSLNCNISFKINVVTSSNEHYVCNVNFEIPLNNEIESIHDSGYITKELDAPELNKFIRIK